MLVLPDGNILYSHMTSQLYVYHPSGSPLAAGKPVINNITPNGDGSYHLTGTGFNGISEGATYGDDLQMNSNYPLVRLTSGGGTVYYARTYNWSRTSVMTGSAIVTTEFTPPTSLPAGVYSLAVVANGIALRSHRVPARGDADEVRRAPTPSGPTTARVGRTLSLICNRLWPAYPAAARSGWRRGRIDLPVRVVVERRRSTRQLCQRVWWLRRK
jgi:hypothetical protein